MTLDPKITKDGQGVFWLEWTPDPTAEGYAFTTPNGASRTFAPTLSKTKLGRHTEPVSVTIAPLDVTARAAETATYPPVVPPPPPPSTGTTHTAQPGQAPNVILTSAPGDTVVCQGGAHPKLVLGKSWAAPGLTVRCEPGAWFVGVDTNGHSGYKFDSIESRLPVELYENNITPFYLHGPSKRISLVGKFKLSGGYDGIKQYGACEDFLLDDRGLGGEITGFGGDGIHINGAINLKVVSVRIHDPSPLVGPEHNDGIHAQAWDGLYIGPGVRLSATNGPRSDVDSAGIFIKKETSGQGRGLVIEGVQIRSWQIGRGMQMLAADGNTIIHTPVIEDCGLPSSPKLTLNSQGGTIECWGVDPDDVHFNSAAGRAATVFHP